MFAKLLKSIKNASAVARAQTGRLSPPDEKLKAEINEILIELAIKINKRSEKS
jgi:hypothetical protein